MASSTYPMAGAALAAFSKDRWPADGAVRALLEYLDELHRDAGQPSFREIGKAVGLAHSTVATFFTGTRLIGRGNLDLLVQVLDGDPARAERLRKKAATEWNTSSLTQSDRRPANQPSHSGNAAGALDKQLFGSLPRTWNVPPRSAVFTGRDALLLDLRHRLAADTRAVAYALSGMGGVGKSQLAIEYAHRFAVDYELVWWVDAEEPTLIASQLADLAFALQIIPVEAGTPSAIVCLRSYLRSPSRWLLIFDNASSAHELAEWVPEGPGHVVITSRAPVWGDVAVAMSVSEFERSESVALLRRQLPHLAEQDTHQLAEALGDLPLALAQAIGVMAATGMPVGEYLSALRTTASKVMQSGRPARYPASLAVAVRLAIQQLAAEDAAAAQLTQLCSLLAPEPIPLWLLACVSASGFPVAATSAAANRWDLWQCVGRAVRLGLLRIRADAVVMHRLVQAIIRDELAPAERDTESLHVMAMLVGGRPDDGTNPEMWPRWAELMPHLLAVNPTAATTDPVRELACCGLRYLHSRGDNRTARPIAEQWYKTWRDTYGPDDHHTLTAATMLGTILRDLGQREQARVLHEEVLARRSQVLGDDHPDTLTAANALGATLGRLGRYEEALAIYEDTLARRRRTLGDDHPDTLTSANNLASNLYWRGQYGEAYALREETLARRRRVLGNDHPATLISADNLGNDLRALGRYEEARALHEETFARRRQVLGDDHPNTLSAADTLANDLRELGQHEQARDLHEDTLTRQRRLLGDDHPATLGTANNLGDDHFRLGQYEQARAYHSDALIRRRRVLGANHPATRATARRLRDDLVQLGRYEQASEVLGDQVSDEGQRRTSEDPSSNR